MNAVRIRRRELRNVASRRVAPRIGTGRREVGLPLRTQRPTLCGPSVVLANPTTGTYTFSYTYTWNSAKIAPESDT
jgi:hypothetical protein